MASIAQTRSGRVEGEQRDGIHVFRGVPYAAPPVGAKRWLAPEREAPWSGVREAKRVRATPRRRTRCRSTSSRRSTSRSRRARTAST